MEQDVIEGENPVPGLADQLHVKCLDESSCLGMQLKMGGKFHLKLNIGERPIANKYREGKMKRTLKRELKYVKLLKGKRLQTADFWSSPGFSPVPLPLQRSGQHRFPTVG